MSQCQSHFFEVSLLAQYLIESSETLYIALDIWYLGVRAPEAPIFFFDFPIFYTY
jgi:hypothetical protein